MIIFNLFMFQGRKEVRVRVHERSEATKDRHAMMQMVIGSATGYFNMKKDERESSRRERKRKAKRRRRSTLQQGGGAMSGSSCSSDSIHSGNANVDPIRDPTVVLHTADHRETDIFRRTCNQDFKKIN